MPDERHPKSARVRRRAEYRRVQSKGRKVHTRRFIVLVHPCPEGVAGPRLSATITKKVGPAVQRNRIKRVLREVFRRHRDLFPAGCDYVFIAKKGATPPGYEELLAELRGARRALQRTATRCLQPA